MKKVTQAAILKPFRKGKGRHARVTVAIASQSSTARSTGSQSEIKR